MVLSKTFDYYIIKKKNSQRHWIAFWNKNHIFILWNTFFVTCPSYHFLHALSFTTLLRKWSDLPQSATTCVILFMVTLIKQVAHLIYWLSSHCYPPLFMFIFNIDMMLCHSLYCVTKRKPRAMLQPWQMPRAAGVFVCLLEYPRGKRSKGTSVERT